jgi:hypothetical protein
VGNAYKVVEMVWEMRNVEISQAHFSLCFQMWQREIENYMRKTSSQ